MLFKETVAVYCENHTEHTNTLCGQKIEFWYVNTGGIYVLSVCLWFYSPFLELGRYFSFLIYTQSVGFLGRGISPSQVRYLNTWEQTQNKRTHKHSYLEWDYNPRSQQSSQ
jgi:hypothetical protein